MKNSENNREDNGQNKTGKVVGALCILGAAYAVLRVIMGLSNMTENKGGNKASDVSSGSELSVISITEQTVKESSSQPEATATEKVTTTTETARPAAVTTTTSTTQKSIIPTIVSSPAKKAVEIVMANEDLWLDLANVYFPEEKVEQLRNSEYATGYGITTYCGCWFEDLDFDGTPEFIMGGFNPGWQGGECYAIYRISGDKLERIYKNSTTPSKWTSKEAPLVHDTVITFHNYSYKHWMRPGIIAAGAGEIIKDKNGQFRFLIPCGGEHINGGYDLTELIVDGRSFNQTYHKIADFVYGPDAETKELVQIGRLPDTGSKYGYRECTQSELLAAVDDFFEDSESYISTIGVIPCSNLMNDKDEKWLADGADTYADRTQRSCYISSCYDNMTDGEKLMALIDSYERYSFKKDKYTDAPYIYKRFVYDVKNEEKSWFHDYDF